MIMAIIVLTNKSYADADEIIDYQVTVDPREDSTLDITYEIKWKVLDSETEGPLSWCQISTPNENFDEITPLSDTIEDISKYKGAYVKIELDKPYEQDEELTIKYKIHQYDLAQKDEEKVLYQFTPAWFTNAKTDNLTIKWKSDGVQKCKAPLKEEEYFIWEKSDIEKGEKYTVQVEYSPDQFDENKNDEKKIDNNLIVGILILAVALITIICLTTFKGRNFYVYKK